MLPAGAGDGDPMLLGTKNHARRVTKLIGRNGIEIRASKNIPLRLYSPDGVPPLQVNQPVRVDGLNADRVDGRHGADFLAAKEYDHDANGSVDAADDADTLDGRHSFEFLSRFGTARDSLHAGDADALQGYPASGLIRVTQGSTSNAPDRTGTAVAASITAPGPGWLVMVGSVDARSNGYDIYACELRVDGDTVFGSARASTVDLSITSLNDEENCSTNGVTGVAAGDHTVSLQVGRVGDIVTFGQASVWALFVPFNGQGNPYTG
jgi:hypothetical protein